MAHWFVVNNSAEIRHYLEQYKSQLENESALDIPKRQQEEFPNWFKNHINQLRVQGSVEASEELWSIANGPLVNCLVENIMLQWESKRNIQLLCLQAWMLFQTKYDYTHRIHILGHICIA